MDSTPLRQLRVAATRFAEIVGYGPPLKILIVVPGQGAVARILCDDANAPVKLTRTEELIVQALRAEDGPLTTKLLMLRCDRSRSAISEATTSLKNKGLVERAPDGFRFTPTEDSDD